MEDLIVKLALGSKISDEDIENELYEICDRVHSSCDDSCPVFRLNGDKPPNVLEDGLEYGCDCFKNGKKMLEFIRK